MKPVIKWAIAGALVLAIIVSIDSCRNANRGIKDIRAEYEGFKAAMLVERAKLDADIAAEKKLAADAVAEADKLRAASVKAKAKIEAQAARIVELQAAEPPTTPEVEAMPIVISLRAQVKAATEGFTLARQTNATLEAENAQLRIAILYNDKIIADLYKRIDLDATLLVASERSFADLSKKHARLKTKMTLKQIGLNLLIFGTGYALGK